MNRNVALTVKASNGLRVPLLKIMKQLDFQSFLRRLSDANILRKQFIVGRWSAKHITIIRRFWPLNLQTITHLFQYRH